MSNVRHIVSIDPGLCTGCQRCHETCPNDAIEGVQGEVQVINHDKCLYCGQCIQTCVSYALVVDWTRAERDEMRVVRGVPASTNEPLFAAWSRNDELFLLKRLESENLYKIVQTAPSIQFSLGEEFGLPHGTPVAGKMVAALRRIGFDKVYNTSFAADLTIMEEATEFVERLKNKDRLPMFTSCCSAWARYLEITYPELCKHLSSCKSPIQMLGSLNKTFIAQEENVDPNKVYSVSIAPCTCKKHEAARDENRINGLPNVDTVITTRGLARVIKDKGIDFLNLPDEEFDNVLGNASGAGNIFATNGGVLEALLRTASYFIDGKETLEIEQVRGGAGVRYAKFVLGGIERKVAIVAGLKNIAPLLEKVMTGEADFDIMEVMCCPSGCISGGGQPKVLLPKQAILALKMRRESVYTLDKSLPQRRSYQNPAIIELYEKFLGKPGSKIAHEILHH